MKVTKRRMIRDLRGWQTVLRESYREKRGRKYWLPQGIIDEIAVLECVIKLVRTVPNP